nr:hypothetical protein [Zea mays]
MADEELRGRAGRVGERARRAVEAGGSSYEAVGALLEDVLRPQRQVQDLDAVRETRRDAEIFN